jgi:hypothetical protein
MLLDPSFVRECHFRCKAISHSTRRIGLLLLFRLKMSFGAKLGEGRFRFEHVPDYAPQARKFLIVPLGLSVPPPTLARVDQLVQ